MNLALLFLGVCLGLFLLINYGVGVFSPDQLALDAAFSACREKGWQDGDLGVTKSNVDAWPLGKTADIELSSKNRNDPKTIRMSLRKPLNMLGWQVVAYKETPRER